ncbi:MAG: hypothetical protein DRG71_04845 [Deltaproteobacteria bacterium]|nr:MAG: hypothetical protein DRG71_04845 [Deltaproteobacteria bacterium]
MSGKMRIRSIKLLSLRIPFRTEFSHSLSNRSQTESIVAVIEARDGIRGYGEGAPRSYVTGESQEQSIAAARVMARELFGAEIHSFEQVKRLLAELGSTKVARENPAAWCSLELAMLDLWGKKERKSVWQLFIDKPKVTKLAYSAVIPLVKKEKLSQLLNLVKELSISFVKLKVGRPVDQTIRNLAAARETLGDSVSIRLDANGAFTVSDCINLLNNTSEIKLSAIEQPVPKYDLLGLKKIASVSDVPIIADESLYTVEGAEYLIDNNICHGINIRISSCGGLIRALQLFKEAKKAGMICQLGAHVGETAILTAAGRALTAVVGTPKYLEGAAGTYLLLEDVSNENISFQKGGYGSIFRKAGLGITVNHDVICKRGTLSFSIQ